MSDKSNWKNKNRDILTKYKEDFAAPWDKDAKVIPELKVFLKGLRPKKKTRAKGRK